MSQPLPTTGFEWVEDQDFYAIQNDSENFINSLDPESDKGYMFEVDLDIPLHLHDKFDDLPPAPVKRKVDFNTLSKSYQLPLINDLGIHDNAIKTEKLICDLHYKHNYIIHYRTLQTYLKMGVEIKKLHKILRFNQSKWLKAYIDNNTAMRNIAKSDFEKNFWKLMNNR